MLLPPLPAIFGLDPTGVIAKVDDQVRSVQPGESPLRQSARKCGSCRMCRSGQPLDCANFTFQGYFRSREIIKVSFPKIPSDLDSRGEAESSHLQ